MSIRPNDSPLALPAPVRASSAPRPGGLECCPPPTSATEAADLLGPLLYLSRGGRELGPRDRCPPVSFQFELFDSEAEKTSAPGSSS